MKRFLQLGLLVALAIAFASCTSPSAPLSSDKEVISFSFLAARNSGFTQDYTATYNAISGAYTAGPLTAGTSLQAVVASFELSAGASLSIDGVPQESGVTANDFSSAKTYTITAADGSTSSFIVSLTRTALGISSFDVAGATLSLGQRSSVTINDTASPRTIVVHVANHFSSDVTALKPTLTSNGSSVTVNGAAHVNGTSSYDFTNPVAFVVNGQTGVSESYQVSVVVDAAVTEALISAFSVAVDEYSYAGVIDDDAGTITIQLPSGTSTDSLVSTFSASNWASVAIGATAQVSGTTTNNFGAALSYVVTAEDGTTTKTYAVTATVNPVIARILEVCPSYSSVYAQSGDEWLDIELVDVSELGDGWMIKASNDSYTNDLFTSSLVADIPAVVLAALQDGDIIRLHPKGYTALDTTADKTGDGVNTDRWDLAVSSTTYFTNYKHSVVSIQKADGTIVDLVAYTSSANTGAWVTSTGLATLTTAVSQAQWPSTNIDSAINIGDTTYNTCHLKSSISTDGNSSTDWEAYQGPMLSLINASVTPSWAQVNTTTSCDVIFTVGTEVYGTPTITAITVDLSDSVFGGDSAQVMYDDGDVGHGDDVAADGIYSYKLTIPMQDITAGSYKTISYAASASVAVTPVTTQLAVSPDAQPTSPVLLIENGDMEADLAMTLHSDYSSSSFATTTGHDGATTRAFHITGTSGSNRSALITTNACNAKPFGYTKASFWIRTDTATIPKVINIEFGTSTSNIPAGQLFKLTEDIASDTYLTPNTSTGSFAYTAYTCSTGGNWTKVTLDVSNTDTASQLLIRLGSATYDFWIDDFYFEP